MKKLLSLTFLFTIVSFLTFAQKNIADQYHSADITLNNGEVVKGYVRMDYEFPATFQNNLTYLTPEDYEVVKSTGKLKTKLWKKLKPADVQHYQLADGRKFVSITYADLANLGMGSFPKKYFYEQLASGKINLYKKLDSGEGVVSGEMARMGQARIDYIQSHYELLLKNDDKNPKNLHHVNLLDYISDNAMVLEKFKANDYGNLKQVFSTKIKIGTGDLNHADFLGDLMNLITDYNREAL